MAPVRNIIFDLGGVLLDIDFHRTHEAFRALGVPHFAELYNQQHADSFFSNFEKGKISPHKFYDHIRAICGCELSNEQILDAWNALLVGFPADRAQWLLDIRYKYRIFLFSNTNILHYQWFARHFEEVTGQDLNACFVKAYYSHEMGMRKPDPEPFRFILDEQKLDARETLFIDDTEKNIVAAKGTGLQTVWLQGGESVMELGL